MCPWNDTEKEILSDALSSATHSAAPRADDLSSPYLARVQEQLDKAMNGILYRSGEGVHQFKLILLDANEGNLLKAYQVELDLQRQFPAESFEFEIFRSPMDPDKMKALTNAGYRRIED